jgi:homoserine kinase
LELEVLAVLLEATDQTLFLALSHQTVVELVKLMVRLVVLVEALMSKTQEQLEHLTKDTLDQDNTRALLVVAVVAVAQVKLEKKPR